MLVLFFFSIILACNMATAFYYEPEPRMGVRFTQRGLERFCQKGYSLVPDIISKMQAFNIPEIVVAGIKISLSNIRPCTVRVSTMKVFMQDDNFVKMEVRDGLMQLSMRLTVSFAVVSGTVDSVLTLKDFGADMSLRVGEDPTCQYHLGLFNISSVVYSSGLAIDAIGVDDGGSIIANAIQGMRPTLESLMKNTVLQSLLNTIFKSLKQSMLRVPIIVQFNEFFSDQRYISGVNIIDNKVVANYGGMITIADPKNWRNQVAYLNPAPLHNPKIVYTDREYELFFDREAINSYLYAWHVAHDKFKATGLRVQYSTIKSQNIPGLKDVLLKEGILSNESDRGNDVIIELAIQLNKDTAPCVPWIGASAIPVSFTGTFEMTASNPSVSITLTSVESSILFSSLFKLRKRSYGFANDQARAYLVLTDLNGISTITNSGGAMDNSDSLLKYMIMTEYLPYLNNILFNPGLPLMNGNFIDITTVTPIYLCNEDRILFIANIEENKYFA